MTRPKLKHTLIQRNLRRLLEKVAPRASFVEIELAFRALPEYELRVADVAYISPEHWKQVNREDHVRGVPDLVIEGLEPSNTVA